MLSSLLYVVAEKTQYRLYLIVNATIKVPNNRQIIVPLTT